jgi:hypothetical protein
MIEKIFKVVVLFYFCFAKIFKGISFDIIMFLLQKSASARYPRLDTILMLEEHIKKCDGEFRKKQLWDSLPKKMMYPTFSIALDYLIVSGKVSVDAEGKIGWIFYPKDVEKRLKEAHLFWNGKS